MENYENHFRLISRITRTFIENIFIVWLYAVYLEIPIKNVLEYLFDIFREFAWILSYGKSKKQLVKGNITFDLFSFHKWITYFLCWKVPSLVFSIYSLEQKPVQQCDITKTGSLGSHPEDVKPPFWNT